MAVEIDNLQPVAVDETGARILDAATAALLRFGIRRTTLESIAREAGVSHMTVYRRWRRKDDVLLAVIMRESQRLFGDLDRRIPELETNEERIVEGFATVYWFFHTHPLLGQMLDTDPESVLPIVTTAAGPMMDFASSYLAQHIRSGAAAGGVPTDPEGTAELLVRICQSLILTPRSRAPLDSEDAAREYARNYLVPIAFR